MKKSIIDYVYYDKYECNYYTKKYLTEYLDCIAAGFTYHFSIWPNNYK